MTKRRVKQRTKTRWKSFSHFNMPMKFYSSDQELTVAKASAAITIQNGAYHYTHPSGWYQYRYLKRVPEPDFRRGCVFLRIKKELMDNWLASRFGRLLSVDDERIVTVRLTQTGKQGWAEYQVVSALADIDTQRDALKLWVCLFNRYFNGHIVASSPPTAAGAVFAWTGEEPPEDQAPPAKPEQPKDLSSRVARFNKKHHR